MRYAWLLFLLGCPAGDTTPTPPPTPSSVVVVPPTPLPAPPPPVVTLRGVPWPSTRPYEHRSLAPNTRIEARTASWLGTTKQVVRLLGGANVHWSGGRIIGTFPDSTSWSSYHDTYALVIRSSPGIVIEGLRIHNYGDATSFDDAHSDGWTVRGNHMSAIHDDCLSNDFGNTGLVEDNLYDGCYMGYSSRAYGGFTGDNRTRVVTFRGNLIRLQDMPTGYAAPGHGKFWKLDRNGIDPRLALYDNIFRVDTPPNCCGGIFLIPPAAYLQECANNVIVWLGPGEFPEPVPRCFTLTRDPAVWERAVTEWLARHPTVPP